MIKSSPEKQHDEQESEQESLGGMHLTFLWNRIFLEPKQVKYSVLSGEQLLCDEKP
jgi:hypothetical protein